MKDKIRDTLYGAIVGDALGVPVEFKDRDYLKKNPVTDMTGYGTYNLPKGSWSDDSSMMLCLADSIGKLSGIDYEDIMKRFWDWFKHSKYTPDHNTFDIGRTCHAAIYNFHQGIEPLECGLKTESDNGNGSLMRIGPLPFYLSQKFGEDAMDKEESFEVIHNVSRLTHGHEISLISCDIFCSLMIEILKGTKKEAIQGYSLPKIGAYIKNHSEYEAARPKYDRIFHIDFKDISEEQIRSTGYVVDNKKLTGISAVQTLSRLNRLCLPFEKHTFVLDFQNKYSDIEKAFEAYYGEIKLNSPSSISDLEPLNEQINGFGFLDTDDVEEFNEILYKTKEANKKTTPKQLMRMDGLLEKAAAIINKLENDMKERVKIRRAINNFNRFYLFLIQVTQYNNEQMHKKFNFLQNVVKKIEIETENNPNIADDVYFKFEMPVVSEVHEEDKPNPNLETTSEVDRAAPREVQVYEDQKLKLSAIIAEINAAHGKNFDVDVVTKNAFQIRDLLVKDEGLKESARNNSEQNFANAFNDSTKQALVAGYKQNKDFYKILLNDEKYRKEVHECIFG